MQNETDVVGAMAKAVVFESHNRGFDDTPDEQARVVIEQLAQAGFEVVSTGSIENLHTTLRTVELGLKLERERKKLARERETSVLLNSGPIDLPRSVARVTVATDTTPDGTNVITFGWSEDGTECWVLNHTFVPSLKAAA